MDALYPEVPLYFVTFKRQIYVVIELRCVLHPSKM